MVIQNRAYWPILLAASCLSLTLGGCPQSDGDGDPNIPPPDTTATTYGGRATIVRASIGGGETRLVDTGELPSTGGVLDETGLTVDINNVLTAEIGHAITIGGNGVSRSEAALANIDLTLGAQRIQADFLMARAFAQCSAAIDGAASTRGELIASNLRINGVVQTVTTAPNQEITLRDLNGGAIGRVVLNELIENESGNSGEVTVNGLRIVVNGAADIVLFSANADIRCAASAPLEEMMTGAGIYDGSRGHVYVAFTGRPDGEGVAGTFAFKDTGTSRRAIGRSVTAYTVVDDFTRRIEGTCDVDGVTGFTYAITATDNGEPGTLDNVVVEFSDGYSSGGRLLAGSVELLKLDAE